MTVYKHSDGYPEGAVCWITKALEHAWPLPRFEADDEKEQRHQTLVDPLAEVHDDPRAPDPDRERRRPHRLVGVPPRRVRPHKRRDRSAQHRHPTARLSAQKAPDRRSQVPGPRGPAVISDRV